MEVRRREQTGLAVVVPSTLELSSPGSECSPEGTAEGRMARMDQLRRRVEKILCERSSRLVQPSLAGLGALLNLPSISCWATFNRPPLADFYDV